MIDYWAYCERQLQQMLTITLSTVRVWAPCSFWTCILIVEFSFKSIIAGECHLIVWSVILKVQVKVSILQVKICITQNWKKCKVTGVKYNMLQCLLFTVCFNVKYCITYFYILVLGQTILHFHMWFGLILSTEHFC